MYHILLIVVLSGSPFVLDTSAKVKITTRECSLAREAPVLKKMIWAEKSRAEVVLGRKDPTVQRGQSFHTRTYGSPYGSP